MDLVCNAWCWRHEAVSPSVSFEHFSVTRLSPRGFFFPSKLFIPNKLKVGLNIDLKRNRIQQIGRYQSAKVKHKLSQRSHDRKSGQTWGQPPTSRSVSTWSGWTRTHARHHTKLHQQRGHSCMYFFTCRPFSLQPVNSLLHTSWQKVCLHLKTSHTKNICTSLNI